MCQLLAYLYLQSIGHPQIPNSYTTVYFVSLLKNLAGISNLTCLKSNSNFLLKPASFTYFPLLVNSNTLLIALAKILKVIFEF